MEEKIQKLKDDLSDKKLLNFWVLCDQATFKAIKMTKTEVKKTLKEKASTYSNKKIANIKIFPTTTGFSNNLWVLSISIKIFPIDANGNIEKSGFDAWGAMIKFYPSDLNKFTFSMKFVEKLLPFITSQTFTTDMLTGVDYKDVENNLKKFNL